jgi:lysyl-tRNA synthetase class 2
MNIRKVMEMTEDRLAFDPRRLENRRRLLEEGENPYPYGFAATHRISQVIDAAEREDLGYAVCLVGRIWARRAMGKVCFMDLRDGAGKIQFYISCKELDGALWERLDALDQGDIIGVSGTVFRTRAGELSIHVEAYQVLAKTTAALPIGKETDERVFARLADLEARYRERHLHWLLEPSARRRMEIRAQTIRAIRQRLDEDGFMEVDTPTITSTYGGAEARPFTTNVWALERQQSYLRISPELHLKRYIIAGFERVFSLCQNFRNEGIDRTHNPEFTML